MKDTPLRNSKVANTPRRTHAYEIMAHLESKSIQTLSRPSLRQQQHHHYGAKITNGSDSPAIVKSPPNATNGISPSGGKGSIGGSSPASLTQQQRTNTASGHHRSSSYHRHLNNYRQNHPYATHTRSANLINHYSHDKYLKDARYASLIRADGNHTLNSSSLRSEKLSDSLTTSGSSTDAATTTDRNQSSNHSSLEKKQHHQHQQLVAKSKKKPKKKKADVDPAVKRFRLFQGVLVVSNTVALICGIVALVAAGFIDPRPLYKVDTFGGQLSLASVYMIITSLAGLYGARRESVTLLVVYAILLIGALFCRSILYFVAHYISSGTSIALSMIAAFLEVLLILSAFALAAEVRIKKLVIKKQQQLGVNTDRPQDPAEKFNNV